jgi:hypothetical protein
MSALDQPHRLTVPVPEPSANAEEPEIDFSECYFGDGRCLVLGNCLGEHQDCESFRPWPEEIRS